MTRATGRDELTDAAADAAIEQACRILRLPTIREHHARVAEAAARQKAGYNGFLVELLADRVRRTRGPPQDPPGPRGRVPPPETPRRLRLHRQPAHRPRPDPHPGQGRLGPRRATPVPDRRLRHRQVPPAHRAGHRRRRGRLPGPLRHRRRPGQRTRRSRRRQTPLPHHRPLRPGRPALPRRTRLPRTRPPRRRTAVPGVHRTRGTRLHRGRLQRRVLRVGPHLHRPPALRRDRRPAHLQRPHHRDRHRVLPATRQPTPTRQTLPPRETGKGAPHDRHQRRRRHDGYAAYDSDYDRVTARDIADFLHHLAELRNGHAESVIDPAQRAAFLSRKADLFTRIAEQAEHTRIDAYSQQIRQMADTARAAADHVQPQLPQQRWGQLRGELPPSAHHRWGQITGEPRGQFWLTQPTARPDDPEDLDRQGGTPPPCCPGRHRRRPVGDLAAALPVLHLVRRRRRPELERLARTIDTWWPGIEAFLHTTITNAASEGYNRIVKLDARNAYGYRNPENQRLRTRCATTRRARRCLNPDQLR